MYWIFMKLNISGDIDNKPQNHDVRITYTQCILHEFLIFTTNGDLDAENLYGYVVLDGKLSTDIEFHENRYFKRF